MIIIYKMDKCEFCHEAEEQLKKLVVPFKVINRNEVQNFLKVKINDHPVIKDGDQIYQGKQQVSVFLEELSTLIEQWRKFQSDSCYADEDGEVC